MPEKKSFILYIERKKEIDMLSVEQCGVLFKAIFEYVDTGSITEIDDLAVKLMFSVFKAQIDRESDKWEEVRKRRSEAGKKSGESRRNKSKQNQTKQTNVNFVEQSGTKRTVNVNVNDNDNDILSLSKDNDNNCQPCTAAGAAAQADSENSIRYGRIIGGSQTIIDEYGYEVIPIDPNDDTWA